MAGVLVGLPCVDRRYDACAYFKEIRELISLRIREYEIVEYVVLDHVLLPLSQNGQKIT